MEQLPVFLNIKDKPVAVFGGGLSAARKADMALRAGAHVSVFATHVSDEFRDIKADSRCRIVARAPQAADIAECVLVFCASEDGAENRAVRELAVAAHVPCNVVDTPELCDFTMPSIVDRSPVVVAISTAGTSPLLGRMIRERLETLLPPSYGDIAAFVGRYREKVAAALTGTSLRLGFWERLLAGALPDQVLTGRLDEANKTFNAALEAAAHGNDASPQGEVYLVGAGPGDPDLLTFKALRLMQRADVVLYDRLIGDGILNLVRRDAERIYVGKQPKDHTTAQADISATLVRLAQQGKRVLRLKAGDPFVFGRGGEEIEMLAQAGIPFQIVPGITAASGCAAYAGIPLTHREHAQACVFVTGHAKDGHIDLDWKALVQPRQTIAVYMGLSSLALFGSTFIANGASPSLPAALIENGTRASQKVLTGTLANIADLAAAAGIKGPAILIVGTVVTLHDKLHWYAPAREPGATSNTDDVTRA